MSTQVAARGARRLDYNRFLEALAQTSLRLYPTLDPCEAFAALCAEHIFGLGMMALLVTAIFGSWILMNVEAAAASTCVEIKILRRVRAESPRRPPRHRRDACSMAWRCRFLAARPSQDGRVIAEK